MKNGLKKFAKGMFAIFTLKLMIFGTVFIVQSCSSESETQNPNSEEFINSVAKSMFNINSIPLSNNLFLRTDEISSTIYLTKDPEQSFDDSETLNSIESIEGLVNISNQYELELSESIDGNDEVIKTYSIPEQPIIDSFEPSIQSAKNYLYSLGFSDLEIETELQGSEESNLVIAVMGLIDAENQNSGSITFNYNDLFGQSAHAMAMPQDWYDCLLRSVGIDAVVELFNGKVTKTIAKKAIRKIVSRTLGWVGAAIAVYQYGDCMGWY
ncbi:MAG: hypothetical protein GWP32_04835 [Bacteroidetes bacterium]|nr:hypothetical protein [Bacteroidota bacterium]